MFYICINKNKEIMNYESIFPTYTKEQKTFTKENQKENRISVTTEQSLNNSIYSNIEISIVGSTNNEDSSHTVWKTKTNFPKKATIMADNLTLDQAIDFANNLI